MACNLAFALNGLGKFTKIGSAWLIMMIAGGALLPLLYAKFADIFNAQSAYLVIVLCIFIYIILQHMGTRKELVKSLRILEFKFFY